MDIDREITLSETINEPVSKVWQALTDKEIIKEYFFGTETESDWKAGSPIIFKGTWEGSEYVDKGTILEIEKEKILKYDYWSSMSGLEDKPENYATITYLLEPKKDKTILTVTQQGFKDEEAYEHSTEGWNQVLKNLKSVVEE